VLGEVTIVVGGRPVAPPPSDLSALADEPRTLVFFESPRRTAATLAALASGFGSERPAAVCRELTKTYEEVRRGTLGELAAWAAAGEVLGEVTIVVGGRPVAPPPSDLSALAAEVRTRVAAGERLKTAVSAVAERAGVQKRALYAASTSGAPTEQAPARDQPTR
jgi:16S rRNA (cytidine1402-2'-O)-methyltransferase